MTHASLFSGIGGFDLAAQWMGWENVFQVEIDKFCQKVLEKNFPNVQRYGDIKEFKGDSYRGTIDVLSGGFPCQPYSSAGARNGKEDDRHLWPEMLRIIEEIHPPYIVGENVYGILTWSGGLVFEEIQTDLEIKGYEVQSFILPACGVNAPHRRDRVWVIAYSESFRNSGGAIAVSRENGRSVRHNVSEPYGTNALHVPRDLDWIVNQEGTTIEPVFRGVSNGLSEKLDECRLESLGNAIVPQVAFEIFKAIEQVNNHHDNL